MTNHAVSTSPAPRQADAPARFRRFRWLLPVLLIIGWVGFLGTGAGYAGKLGTVVRNDNAAFLPADAEATRVAAIESEFLGAEQVPAVVVYVRESGITDTDRSAVGADIRFIQSVKGTAGQIAGPAESADGRALQVVVPLSTTGDATALPAAVRDIRARAQSHPGLVAHVTGPGGMSGDFADIFQGADLRLLLIASAAVFIILVLVYRSVLLPVLVLLTAQLAQTLASVAVYFLARHDVINLNGQSQGALILICLGTATDYALLIVGRYREELRDRGSKYAALLASVRRCAPTILASGLTVIVAMLCLLLSQLSSNRGYGPVLGLGVAASLIATFTFLPAVLALLGRAAFWPVPPRHGPEHPREGVWGWVARVVAGHTRVVWVGASVALLACAAFLPTFRASGSPMSEQFLGHRPDSVIGLDVLATHYPAGAGDPAIITGPAAASARLAGAAARVSGVDEVSPYRAAPTAPPKVVDGRVLLQATLSDPADSAAAQDTVRRLRDAVHAVDAGALVGGTAAINLDTVDAGWTDLWTVIPLVLFVVLLLLVVLLRAVMGPLLLIGTVVLSVAATVGLAAIADNWILDLPASDASLPLFCAVFLIAVGVDYNMFLMARVREESARLRDCRAGVVRGLTTTGGVITSAGVVLGVTFAMFAVLPFVPLVQIAVIIVIGVLIDTFVVRALLVPAAAHAIGRAVWWPSALGRRRGNLAGGPLPEPLPDPAAAP